MLRIFQALGIGLRNGARSFLSYYKDGFDPLTRDALTRAYNRPCFERRRRRLEGYSLLLIDIDNFKQINDRHGHSAGDTVLKAVAAALRTRSGDRVFRVGGEEFAVLLRCPGADARGVAWRLCEEVRSLELLKDAPVTISIGVAWTRAASEHQEVYDRADAALYRAKGQGKDQVVSMDEPPRAKPELRLSPALLQPAA